MSTERYPTVLSASTIIYAREHLTETPEKSVEYVRKIRDHFETNEPNTTRITTDDSILLGFLRGCKYNLARTIEKIRSYYKVRRDDTQTFTNRDPRSERMQELLQVGLFLPLRRLQNGSPVFLVRVSVFQDVPLSDIYKMIYLILDVCNKLCPQLQIHGFIAIVDIDGLKMNQIAQCTPPFLRKVVRCWENYYCSPKMMLFINVPTIFNAILNMLKSFMSKKLQERVHSFSGGYEEIADIIDMSILPTDCGGDDGRIQDHTFYWVKAVTNHADWIVFDEQFKML